MQSRQQLIKAMKVGDSCSLVREPHNPVDPNAIAVKVEAGCVGFIPSRAAKHIAPCMDEGMELRAKVVKIHEPGKLYGNVKVDVEIFEQP